MNIQDLKQRIKPSDRTEFLNKVFLSLIMILLASLSFGLGRLSVVGNREPVKIEMDPSFLEEATKSNSVPNTASAVQVISGSSVVASSKGSKYHYPHCPGAKQISEANKITFASAKEAENAGYTLAANCKPK